jgi:hypothetical protein
MEVRPTVSESIQGPERRCAPRGFRVFWDRGFAALPATPRDVATLPLVTNGGTHGLA